MHRSNTEYLTSMVTANTNREESEGKKERQNNEDIKLTEIPDRWLENLENMFLYLNKKRESFEADHLAENVGEKEKIPGIILP